MKNLYAFQILTLLICYAAFVCAAIAQEDGKPQATLIGYQNVPEDLAEFDNLTERLIARLRQEPAATVGLIAVMDGGALAKRVKNILRQHPDLPNKIFFGFPFDKNFHRPTESFVSFWIVPTGANRPDIGCRPFICVCPTIKIGGAESADDGYPTFTAELLGGNEDGVITYKWDISGGKIIEGQGTPMIKVDAEDSKEVTATVEIGGLDCEECDRFASATVKVEKKLNLIAVDGRVYNEQILMNLDELLRELKKDATRRAYIINYGSRAGGARDLARRKWMIARYFSLINADTSRITLMDGGYRKEVTSELWISTDENQKPISTPTVNRRFVGVPATPKIRRGRN